MKEFFTQQLEELEFKTGLRQLHWMMQGSTDQVDFHKKKTILLDSMVRAAEKYPIPENQKRVIILKQIEEDQAYDGLNARVVHKWLSLPTLYLSPLDPEPEAPRVILTEEENKRIDELAETVKRNLMGSFKPSLTGVTEEMEKIKAEDAERIEGRKKANGYTPPTPEEIERRELHLEWIRANFDPITRDKLPGFMEEQEWIKQLQY